MNGMLQYWAEIVVAIGTITAGIIAGFRFLILKPLITLIDERTKQIQPNANGGKSLTDLHLRIDTVEETQKQILEMVTKPARRKKETDV